MPEPGFIFDWHGVIVDLSPLQKQCQKALAEDALSPLIKNHFRQGFGSAYQGHYCKSLTVV